MVICTVKFFFFFCFCFRPVQCFETPYAGEEKGTPSPKTELPLSGDSVVRYVPGSRAKNPLWLSSNDSLLPGRFLHSLFHSSLGPHHVFLLYLQVWEGKNRFCCGGRCMTGPWNDCGFEFARFLNFFLRFTLFLCSRQVQLLCVVCHNCPRDPVLRLPGSKALAERSRVAVCGGGR